MKMNDWRNEIPTLSIILGVTLRYSVQFVLAVSYVSFCSVFNSVHAATHNLYIYIYSRGRQLVRFICRPEREYNKLYPANWPQLSPKMYLKITIISYLLLYIETRSHVFTHCAQTGCINVVSTAFQRHYVEPMWNRRWNWCPAATVL